MRNKCADEETLGEYIEGVLGENERCLVEKHLAECDTCRQELIIGNGIVRGGGQDLPQVPDAVTKSALNIIDNMELHYQRSLSIKVKRAINTIYTRFTDFMELLPWWRWGFMPVRGKRQVVTEDLIHVQRIYKNIRVELDIEKIGKNKTNIRIKLFKDKTSANGIRVTLMKKKRELSSILSDSSGLVLFDNIAYGHYSLIFVEEGIKLGEYLFEIKELDHGR
ncbi:zf-HC2 domain-containing protein [Thermodesulfobacteriota bacterium]